MDTDLTKRGTLAPINNSSRDLVKIQLQHDMKIQDEQTSFNNSTYWESACLRFDKRAVSYFGQMIVGGSLIAFCITMLSLYQDCATFSRYSPLLTLVVGILLPGPQLHRRTDD